MHAEKSATVEAPGTSATSRIDQPRGLAELVDLEEVIATALEEPTILAGATEAGLPHDLMRERIWRQLEELDRIVVSERRRLDDDERASAALQTDTSFAAPQADQRLAELARTIAIVCASVGLLAGVIYLFLRFATSIQVPQWILVVAGALLLVAGALLPNALLVLRRVTARRASDYDVHTAQVESAAERVRISRELLVAGAIEKAIRPALREFVNAGLKKDRYGLKLTVDQAPGLAELENPDFEIPTSAAERLRQLFRTMPGGSIGIAGPRGSGKSTLIRKFCSDREPAVSTRPKVGVQVSAPVDYEARDFLLHLFACFCRAMGGTSAAYDDPSMESRFKHSALARMLLSYGRVLVPLLFAVGVLWIVVATVPTLDRFRPDAEIVGGALLVAFSVWLLFELRRELLRQHRSWQHEEDQRQRQERQSQQSGSTNDPSEWLRRIKFQQSYASGWSGSLKLPLGFQGGVTATSTMAQLQLSLPEIVEGFRTLVEAAAADNEVVIGIDELDKIESREKAEMFLNDIKAIFGIERCFYLISVSEDAMANFERRGLPFRDAFDSALDEVVKVDYLQFGASTALVRRRVVGMTVPFMALCHCLSGGLARDLIRYARTLVDLREGASQPTIGAVTRRAVAREIGVKLEAIAVGGRGIRSRTHRAEFLIWIHGLASRPGSAQRILRECEIMAANLSRSPAVDGQAPEQTADMANLADLRRETSCFLYFAATLLEFFSSSLDATKMRDAETRGRRAGGIDQLAVARQRFSVDPYLAWQLITSFRRHHGLTRIALPRASGAAPKPVGRVGNGSSGVASVAHTD